MKNSSWTLADDDGKGQIFSPSFENIFFSVLTSIAIVHYLLFWVVDTLFRNPVLKSNFKNSKIIFLIKLKFNIENNKIYQAI